VRLGPFFTPKLLFYISWQEVAQVVAVKKALILNPGRLHMANGDMAQCWTFTYWFVVLLRNTRAIEPSSFELLIM